MIQLFGFLHMIYPLSAELEQALRQILKVREIPRGRHWLRQGEVCNNIAFIEAGLLKIYTERNGKEVVIWFNKENDIIISVKSFFKRLPSVLAIQALEKTRVLYTEHADLQRIYEKYPAFNINGRIITQEYYTLSEDHVMLMHLPAKERYYELLRLFPWMGGRVKDKEMAAYLGVAPQTLSGIKTENKGKIDIV